MCRRKNFRTLNRWFTSPTDSFGDSYPLNYTRRQLSLKLHESQHKLPYYCYRWEIWFWDPHQIGGNLKLLRESTNADQKRLKIVFLIANCRFRLPICNLKHRFNPYRPSLLDSRDSSRLSPIRCWIIVLHRLPYYCCRWEIWFWDPCRSSVQNENEPPHDKTNKMMSAQRTQDN